MEEDRGVEEFDRGDEEEEDRVTEGNLVDTEASTAVDEPPVRCVAC